ncbi:hypothetical protein NLI96_g12953 [Meripilus lineatus]|uniref:Uncharacterized protein n=1 Tax=Meripilus lineatus TaxID=2056292 RepID=A0AAD5UQ90_9APHY|nr:hypothetical protein NLI96_g12953 [Physisporinus lineatus]
MRPAYPSSSSCVISERLALQRGPSDTVNHDTVAVSLIALTNEPSAHTGSPVDEASALHARSIFAGHTGSRQVSWANHCIREKMNAGSAPIPITSHTIGLRELVRADQPSKFNLSELRREAPLGRNSVTGGTEAGPSSINRR